MQRDTKLLQECSRDGRTTMEKAQGSSTQIHSLGSKEGQVAAAAAHDGDDRRDVHSLIGRYAQRFFQRTELPLMVVAGRTLQLPRQPLHPLMHFVVELFFGDHDRRPM